MLLTTLCFSAICFIAYSSTIVATLTVDVDRVTSFRGLLKMGFQIMFHEDQDYLFVEEVSVLYMQRTGFMENRDMLVYIGYAYA